MCIRRGFVLLLALTAAGLAAALLLTRIFVTETYEATATLCVRNKSDYPGGITAADIAASEALTEPLFTVMQTEQMLRETAERYGFDSAASLRAALSFSSHTGGLFDVTLTMQTPEDAAAALSLYLETVMREAPASINAGALSAVDEISVEKHAIPYFRNAVLGLAAGATLGICILMMRESEPFVATPAHPSRKEQK